MSFKELSNYFQKNRNKIIKGHIDEYVVIYQKEVKGYFTDEESALLYCSENKYKLGEFMVKQCLEQDDETQRFYSRVSFAK